MPDKRNLSWDKLTAGLLALATGSMCVNAAELVDPKVFTSNPNSHTLNVLMLAKAAPINAIPGVTGWVHDICLMQQSSGNTCPANTDSPNLYGGSRLQLTAGDTLNIHLVNKLPMVLDSAHAHDAPGEQYLAQNPTNLHTHGLLVAPRYPSVGNQTYGDNIFVLTFNGSNGPPLVSPASHIHGAINMNSTDYSITLPPTHPSGLYWIHPHAHGVSANQLGAGMSSIITIGQPSDYITNLPSNTGIRHLILKDVQVFANKKLKDQEDSSFCNETQSLSGTPGICHGLGQTFTGGNWYFTINGQLNPTITVDSPGQIWRITNASASATYELQLNRSNNGVPTSNNGMIMQLLSIDGVSATPVGGASQQNLVSIGGNEYQPAACPGAPSNSNAVCITQLHLMGGSRAEVWVTNRDSSGNVIRADGSQAVLQTIGYNTGPAGDTWPPVILGQVAFSGASSLNGVPQALTINDANHDSTGLNYTAISQSATISAANAAAAANSTCTPLPAGYKRRIFFGYPIPSNFGIGFEILDQNGTPVPNSFQDVTAFPGATKSICLPLATGNNPANENWEIINLTAEDHNFHIHQTKFNLLPVSASQSAEGGNGVYEGGILQDSVPLLSGSGGCDGTVTTWRNGGCTVTPVEVNIPFAVAGDFVFHCHILEHEDGGMMAAVHIVKAP